MRTEVEDEPSGRQRRNLRVLISLFIAMFFIWGGTSNTIQIFLTPLMKQHGWSHTRASALPTGYSLAVGLGGPLVGLLIDRFDVCLVMACGTVLAALGMILLGFAVSFWAAFGSYALVGLGAAASVSIPAAVVAVNWFGDRRGSALGITLGGSALGGMALPLLADHFIRSIGIAETYFVLGAMIALFPLPPILLFIRARSRPASPGSDEAKGLSGLELNLALRHPPLWILVAVQISCSLSIGALFYQTVPALIQAGYGSRYAALAASSVMGVAIAGVMLMGTLSDRFTGRKVLPLYVAALGTAPLLLLGAHGTSDWRVCLTAFVIVFGLSTGVTSCVTPMVLAEVLGLQCFGTLNGILSMAGMVAGAVAPVVIGWLVDRTGSFAFGFATCASICYVAAAAAFLISPAEGIEELPVGAISGAIRH